MKAIGFLVERLETLVTTRQGNCEVSGSSYFKEMITSSVAEITHYQLKHEVVYL